VRRKRKNWEESMACYNGKVEKRGMREIFFLLFSIIVAGPIGREEKAELGSMKMREEREKKGERDDERCWRCHLSPSCLLRRDRIRERGRGSYGWF